MASEKVKSEFVIHWKELLFHVLKRWWIILLSMIVGAAAGIMFAKFTYRPVYETRTSYIVGYSGAGDTMGELSSEYSFVQRVLNNCIEIADQNKFYERLEEVVNAGIEKGSASYLGAGQLKGATHYDVKTNTTVLVISVQTGDAQISLRIAKGISEIFVDYIHDVYPLGENESLVFNPLDAPTLATAPMEGSKTVMYGILIGLAFGVLAAGILFIIAMADNRIKIEADINDKYDIPILGIIPRYEDIVSTKGDNK